TQRRPITYKWHVNGQLQWDTGPIHASSSGFQPELPVGTHTVSVVVRGADGYEVMSAQSIVVHPSDLNLREGTRGTR
ncbi:MAG: hypothetical protein NW201_03930, partial [Gemmatimonadales bacterium]|nr:hypothetical protein [Gemmatimonadales bacterium]